MGGHEDRGGNQHAADQLLVSGICEQVSVHLSRGGAHWDGRSPIPKRVEAIQQLLAHSCLQIPTLQCEKTTVLLLPPLTELQLQGSSVLCTDSITPQTRPIFGYLGIMVTTGRAHRREGEKRCTKISSLGECHWLCVQFLEIREQCQHNQTIVRVLAYRIPLQGQFPKTLWIPYLQEYTRTPSMFQKHTPNIDRGGNTHHSPTD